MHHDDDHGCSLYHVTSAPVRITSSSQWMILMMIRAYNVPHAPCVLQYSIWSWLYPPRPVRNDTA